MKTPSVLLLISLAWTAAAEDVASPAKSVLRVRVSNQTYSILEPWRKQSPGGRRGLGTCVGENQFLVTADLVKNAQYVELEHITHSQKAPARVMNVDYFTNLAIVEALDPAFTKDLIPLSVQPVARVGQEVRVWQFEQNGAPVTGDGTIKSIEIGSYGRHSAKLTYKLDIKLEAVGSSFVLPVLSFQGALTGLSMSYSSSGHAMTVVPGLVIDRYLTDLADGDYTGFPRAGFSFAALEDPQLRAYLDLDEEQGGVFISDVGPNGAAEEAGLLTGDVLLKVGEYEIDRRGEFQDPDFGRQAMAHLTTTRLQAGERVELLILREGKEMALTMSVRPLAVNDFPSRPFLYDRAPRFLIAGGFVFQEMSRAMLEAWGKDWPSSAPQRLVYYERNQWDVIGPGKRLVVLTRVLPTPGNIGYHHFALDIVSTVNGIDINRLEDLQAAFGKPQDEFHTIRFRHNPERIVIEADALVPETKLVQSRYGIPLTGRLN